MKSARGLALLVLAPLVCLGLEVAHGADAARREPPDADSQDLVIFGPLRPLLVRLHVTIDGKPFRQAWQERFNELFTSEDRDRDGRVTVEQGDAIARDLNGGLRDTPRSVAKDSQLRASAGADGTVDRAALSAYVQKILPIISLHHRAVISQGSALALFPLLDQNEDHQLSAAELGAAEEQLKQRDFDGDAVITGVELILDPNALAAASDPGTDKPSDKAAEGPAMLVDADATSEAIAARLVKQYDHNRDGRLSSAAPEREISLPSHLMSRFDANADGVLVSEELAGFADRQPDLELTLPLGRVTSAERRGNRQRLRVEPEWRARRKLDGGFKLNLGEADIDFNRNNRDPQQADLFDFRTFDADKNDYLDEREAGANNVGTSAFAAMDIDGNKKVFKGEFTSFINRQNQAAATRLQLEVSDLGQDLFAVLDGDLDGVLSPRELRTAKDVLAVEDKNGDGSLGGDEIPQRLIFELVRGAESPAETEARVTRGRVARSAAKASTAGPLWFRKMDRNNDGDLSPQEFVGPSEAFQKLDTDGDGLVDRQEAEAAGN